MGFQAYSFLLGLGGATALFAIFYVFMGRSEKKPITVTKTITETVEKVVYKDREPTVEECVEMIKKAEREDLLARPFTVEEAYLVLKQQSKVLKLDPTKRNSLQPGSMPGGPGSTPGMDEILTEDQKAIRQKIQDLQKAEREMFVPSTYHADLEHKFYGTQVTIGRWSRSGLDKRLHLLEITENQMYIDGSPQTINPSDLEHIKQVLQASKVN
jgi:hypothetical protein